LLGQAIPQGMAQGITQGASQVSQSASTVAQGAVSAARSTLGIASPSRVFFDIGRSSAEGFGEGMKSGGYVVGNESQSLGQIAAAGAAEGAKTGMVANGVASGELISGTRYTKHGTRDFDDTILPHENMISYQQWEQDQAMTGGFGSGVIAASDGTKGIAQSQGLQVGDVWARSVVTGVDNVLTTADFAALVVPQIGSALAESALGAAQLLPPAGSGAEYYNTSSGNAGMVNAPVAAPQPIVITNTVMMDGTVIDTKINTAISSNNAQLADSIGNQRG
jgi:hypothetical protein